MTYRLTQSQQTHEKALRKLVGGVNSPVRSFSRVGGTPILGRRAKGSFLWDLDDNKYLDLVMSYGPHLMGHAYEPIVSKVEEILDQGFCWGLSSEAELQWAEEICRRLPSIEKVRAMSTGTEACMTAVRLARGYTHRDIILKCSGHYHGHVDALMVDSGSGIATLSESPNPDSAGLTSGVIKDTRVIPFNDVLALEKAFEAFGDKIAGFILEPVMGNMGVIPGSQEFLNRARELTQKHGSVLIFDEVMTGFRVHPQSCQGLYNIVPDLTCLGKIVGGGLPLSALGGKENIMNALAPLGKVYQAGTLSGNPISIGAGIAMLQSIEKEDPYLELEELGRKVEKAFYAAANKAKVDIVLQRVASMFSVFFRKDPVQNAEQSRQINYKHFTSYFWSMAEEGILLPPSPFESYFLAKPHCDDLLISLDQKLERVFEKVAKA